MLVCSNMLMISTSQTPQISKYMEQLLYVVDMEIQLNPFYCVDFVTRKWTQFSGWTQFLKVKKFRQNVFRENATFVMYVFSVKTFLVSFIA